MAFCPKCGGEMGDHDAACPKCGYDFPEYTKTFPERRGLEFSAWASYALNIAGIVMLLSALASLLFSIAMLLQGNWLQGLFSGPISFILSIALLIVFLRVEKIK